MLGPKLDKRISIRELNQVPADNGGLTDNYIVLKEVWAGLKVTSRYTEAVREVQTAEKETHVFTVRLDSVRSINPESENPVKKGYYIFLNNRSFRVNGAKRDEENKLYLKIYTEEIEENDSTA
ncbi:MAG: head-tail adaptor protein [bacterium]|nr:head-tail adaptor protein [bacterium]